MTRRTCLMALSALLARAADRLPANKNIKWALGSNLWNSFPPVPFTDILDIMRDTGFIGIRLTQFPQILTKYNITAEQMEAEVDKRHLHVITVSISAVRRLIKPDIARADPLLSAKEAMTYLKRFGADHPVRSFRLAADRLLRPSPSHASSSTVWAKPRTGWASEQACTTIWGRWCKRRRRSTAAWS